jgi:hydrogenase nickel incorporation protein HypB
MCSVCGCGEGEVRIEGHHHGHGHEHGHAHPLGHHDQRLAPAAPTGRLLTLEQDILAVNNRHAAANRRRLQESATLALNLVSSPGSGKTALLTRTLGALAGELTMAVIEGDQQTSNDAERIRATGARAVQINTGKGCHLDAHMVGHALDELLAQKSELLFIENVGNLVCPAAFDLGEARRVVILSVTEGEDKPLKYPDIFAGSDLMILNKCDLLPHLEFDVAQCIDYARRINPRMQVIQLSARSGEGCEQWYQWLRAARQMQRLQG